MIALHGASMVPSFSENGNMERVRNNEIHAPNSCLSTLSNLATRELQAMHIM